MSGNHPPPRLHREAAGLMHAVAMMQAGAMLHPCPLPSRRACPDARAGGGHHQGAGLHREAAALMHAVAMMQAVAGCTLARVHPARRDGFLRIQS